MPFERRGLAAIDETIAILALRAIDGALGVGQHACGTLS